MTRIKGTPLMIRSLLLILRKLFKQYVPWYGLDIYTHSVGRKASPNVCSTVMEPDYISVFSADTIVVDKSPFKFMWGWTINTKFHVYLNKIQAIVCIALLIHGSIPRVEVTLFQTEWGIRCRHHNWKLYYSAWYYMLTNELESICRFDNTYQCHI